MEDTMTADKTAIRPFQMSVPEEELTELRRRINATRWPERETVTDQSQGVQLATVQALARYWATGASGIARNPHQHARHLSSRH
jgi:hypothetical protein